MSEDDGGVRQRPLGIRLGTALDAVVIVIRREPVHEMELSSVHFNVGKGRRTEEVMEDL